MCVAAGVAAAKTTILPITSDKGLCGGINSTVVKYTKIIDGIAGDSGSASNLFVVGEKGRAQLARGATQQKVSQVVVDTAKSKDGISFVMASMVADAILKDGYEKLQIVYNRFQSVIAFKPTVATLLSTPALEAAADEGGLLFDSYEVEGPDRSEFLLDLGEFQLAATLYNALLENSTSELGSRMQSMENSTKNAQEMLAKLTLYYNRTRQAAITTELIEARVCLCCIAVLRERSAVRCACADAYAAALLHDRSSRALLRWRARRGPRGAESRVRARARGCCRTMHTGGPCRFQHDDADKTHLPVSVSYRQRGLHQLQHLLLACALLGARRALRAERAQLAQRRRLLAPQTGTVRRLQRA